MKSEMCKTCVHTKVCMLDKNIVGDIFLGKSPILFDNREEYENYKKWKEAGFPCDYYMPEIIRCKDCKHKPHTSDKYDYDNGDCGLEIIFPDYRCPCRCDDEYYNHIPDDDWFCGNAERRTDE